jgi:hypothetical protein
MSKFIVGRNHPASLLAQPDMEGLLTFFSKMTGGVRALGVGPEMPWSSVGLVNSSELTQQHPATAYISYALVEFVQAGKPYWKLDQDVVEAFLKTDPPIDMLDELPRLPHRGLYCEVPAGSYQIHNEETGYHDAWGFYLVEDLMLVDPETGDARMNRAGNGNGLNPFTGEWRRAITLIACGEIRNATISEVGVNYDDALVFGKWADTTDLAGENFPPLRETWRLAINLLIALQGGYLGMRKMTPLSDKKSPGKRKILERKGICDHTVISLSKKARAAQKVARSDEKADGRKVRAHVRRGHWRRTWVLDPSDDAVVAKQEREGKSTLHAVLRWIPPTHVGVGPVETKPAIVRL